MVWPDVRQNIFGLLNFINNYLSVLVLKVLRVANHLGEKKFVFNDERFLGRCAVTSTVASKHRLQFDQHALYCGARCLDV